MISFNEALNVAIVQQRAFGRAGAPWEFNLRDVLRWCQLATAFTAPDGGAGEAGDAAQSEIVPRADGAVGGSADVAMGGVDELPSVPGSSPLPLQAPCLSDGAAAAAAASAFPLVYAQRLRTEADRAAAWALFQRHFPGAAPRPPPCLRLTPAVALVGVARLPRSGAAICAGLRSPAASPPPPSAATASASADFDSVLSDSAPGTSDRGGAGGGALLLRAQLPAAEAAAAALSQGWMVALVGPLAAGKKTVARALAALAGATLREVWHTHDPV